jgi:hypothetical protein
LVTRTEATRIDEFEGKVVSVKLEMGIEDRRQYHIEIEPTSFKSTSATGKIHEWIALSPKSTEEAVPQGSVMDRYLTQVEICVSGAKNCKTVGEELKMLEGKKFKFKKLKLGKDFNGQPAKEYIVPVAAL